MKWEKTVLPLGTREAFRDRKDLCEVQAKVAFEAGEKNEKSKLAFNPDYLDFKKGVEAGRKLGRKEVVDWVEAKSVKLQAYSIPAISIATDDWEFEKKEWEYTQTAL